MADAQRDVIADASWRTDAMGTVHAAATDARIACLVPSITELLFDLGLGDAVVARTGYCIHPAGAVERVPKVGGTKSINLGKLQRLAPTHAIVNIDENRREDVEAMRAFVPHIVVTHPLTPADNRALYRLMGAIFGRVPEAERAVGEFDAALGQVRSIRFAPKRVVYLIWRDPWMAVGRDTYVSRMLAEVDWHTVPEASPECTSRYPTVVLDEGLLSDVDLVLLSTEPYAFTAEHAQALAREVGAPVKTIDGELASWYGTRAIRALRELPKLRAAIDAEGGIRPE